MICVVSWFNKSAVEHREMFHWTTTGLSTRLRWASARRGMGEFIFEGSICQINSPTGPVVFGDLAALHFKLRGSPDRVI